MQIRVLFFGMLKDLAGQGSDSLDLPENAVLGDVLSHYEERVPRLKDLMASIAMSVNQEYAGRDSKLKQGDEVALLPPVSGGSADKSSETAVRQPAEPALSERSEPKDRRFKHAAIVRERIDTESLLEGIKQPEDGAAVVFEGIVRNHSRGRRTLYLDYEAYEKMALKQMEELAEQSLSRF